MRVRPVAVGSLPPDHRPFRCSANDGATALYAIGRWNGNHPDAARVDGQVVMKRRLIEVAMYRGEIIEVGPATSLGIKPSLSERRLLHAAQRGDQLSKGDIRC